MSQIVLLALLDVYGDNNIKELSKSRQLLYVFFFYDYLFFLNMMQALWPPNPKVLFIATLTSRF